MSLSRSSIYALYNPEQAILEVACTKSVWSSLITAVRHVAHWRSAESIRATRGATYGGSNDIQRLRYIFALDLKPHGKSNARRVSKIISVVVIVTEEGRVILPSNEFKTHYP